MFKLRYGMLISGIITGCILLASFFTSLPDGNLHIVFCDVGQGDAAYVRFPDGRDMLVDGGPNDKVIGCLSRHMPFWDRDLDMVILSHPQNDHLKGLITVLSRYRVGYVVKSDVDNETEGYQELMKVVEATRTPVKLVGKGETVTIGVTHLTMVWPSSDVLGATTQSMVNDASVVFWLRYGTFDAFFPGDADNRVAGAYTGSPLADGQVEVLKVPHHGSKTGMTNDFIQWLRPKLAVISVGNNSYGHPAREMLEMLESVGATILRTDKSGDIAITSDGTTWSVLP